MLLLISDLLMNQASKRRDGKMKCFTFDQGLQFHEIKYVTVLDIQFLGEMKCKNLQDHNQMNVDKFI